MTKKMTGKRSGGIAQPEIRKGDKWRDGRGDIVTVKNTGFNRITFIRDGYPSPCVHPEQRFLNEFQPVKG